MRFCIALVVLVLLPSLASAEARVALLIGNQGYAAKVGPLKNPHSDVLLVGAALRSLGFKVTELKDADYRSTDAAIKRHIAMVRREGQGTISFVYYSGHGAADPDTKINYLIPVDVANADDEELWNYSINLNTLVENLRAQAPGATHYVVFDACRNELNLTRRGQKALTAKGFVPMAYTPGVMVAYATAPGGTASDTGTGGGTYAKTLADEIVRPGIDSMLVFTRVARRVQHEIGQDPFLSASTMPEIYFAGNSPSAPPPQPDKSELERAWEFIKETDDPARLEAFVKRFPDAPYAQMARARLQELKKKTVAVPQPSSPAAPSEASSAPSPEGRGWLGVKINNIDQSTTERLGLADTKGALIMEITSPGPAAEAGLRTGDVILSINGRIVADARDFAQQIANLAPSTKVMFGIFRDRKEGTLAATLGKLPSIDPLRTNQSTMISQFNGDWRVVYSYNEHCRTSGPGIGHWKITDGVVVGKDGYRGTISSAGEVRLRLPGERTYLVRAQLGRSHGVGNFQIEGRRCGGSVSLDRI
jgi:hypothetical protein